ncbi:MAG: hypothetical protein HFJ60_07020 [Clostridia bacterium]|jgi:hypothetical protein|nr:hypothetical protein [Clostridia bacterium]
MKRCFMWVVNWFIQWVHKMEIEERIGFAIGGVIGIVVGIALFVSVDKVPAMAIDYEPLEKQMSDIQQNPNLLLKTKCNISITDDVITVIFSNDKCKLTVKYDQNFEVLSTSKTDQYMFWLWALGLAVLIGTFVYALTSFLLTLVVYLLEILWEFICDRLKSIKSKKS